MVTNKKANGETIFLRRLKIAVIFTNNTNLLGKNIGMQFSDLRL